LGTPGVFGLDLVVEEEAEVVRRGLVVCESVAENGSLPGLIRMSAADLGLLGTIVLVRSSFEAHFRTVAPVSRNGPEREDRVA
jgi:hypothetical protein